MLTRKQYGPAGCTNRISNETPVEYRTFFCQPVDIRGLKVTATIGTNGLESVVITHYIQDIGRFYGFALGYTSKKHE
jgi:hypothetical protein